jgi:thiol:disulfide interchange protein
MKGKVIAQKEVQDVLKGFVVAELYTDGTPWEKENNQLLKERFKTPALPLYVTLGPDGKVRSRLLGTASKAEFLEFLKKGVTAAAQGPASATK